MMKTMDLLDASKLLMLHPQTILQRARSGELPAAKPGKCWVFIEEDLINWLRQQYTYTRQDVSANKNGESTCSLKESKARAGIINFPLTEKQYTDLLAPATKRKHKR